MESLPSRRRQNRCHNWFTGVTASVRYPKRRTAYPEHEQGGAGVWRRVLETLDDTSVSWSHVRALLSGGGDWDTAGILVWRYTPAGLVNLRGTR